MVDVTTHQVPWHATGHHPRQRTFTQSSKLQDVLYEIRGPVHEHAARLEAEGHRILKLNIGNPAPFGFEAPDVIMRDMIQALPYAQGYSDSKGIHAARRAVFTRYELVDGFPRFDVDDVYLGNGVSELITMTLQALLDNGDQVLIPAPDYPLWTASTSLAGGTPVHYLCDETQGWKPDIADLESKITDRTKAIVVINPNNPTGAVYSREVLTQMADLARKHQLLLLADEIYDKILYDDAKHIALASVAPDVLTLTFNGLSKAYRVAGYRSGWLVITGPKEHAEQFHRGHQPAGQYAAVPECACAARHPGRPRRAPEHRGSGAARRPAARAARRRVDQAQRDPRGVVRETRGRAVRRSRGSIPRSTTSPTTSNWCWICCCRRRSWSPRAPDSTGPHPITCASSPCRGPATWPTPSSGSATSWPATASRFRRTGPASTLVRVTHSHAHSHTLHGPSPLGPLAAKIVVGMLVAIGVAVVAGAALLWPSQEKVDIPLPFQNAAGGAVTTEAGHVLSSGSADCGGPRSARCSPDRHRSPAQGAAVRAVAGGHRLRPERRRHDTCWSSAAARASPTSPPATTSASAARSTSRAPRPTRSTTTNAHGR